METCDLVHVFIGSPKKLPDYRNPIDLVDRTEILRQTFEGVTSLRIHTIDDLPTDIQWIEAMNIAMNNLTDYGDPNDCAIFCGEKDKEYYSNSFVNPVIPVDITNVSATAIRSFLYKGKEVPGDLLPPVSKAFVDSFVTSSAFEDLKEEYKECTSRAAEAKLAHKFNNPIEPVVHAAVVQDGKILLVRRVSKRGNGQWALPGGFLESTESTIEGALRELKEETGVVLEGKKATMLAQTVEENLNDLSVRTLGVNYLFGVFPKETLEVTIDPKEVSDYRWHPVPEILSGEFPLFYNHNTVVQRLFADVSARNPPESEDG